MTKNRSNPVMEVKRPVPADITFIEPTTILSPYHKRCDFKNKNLKEAERAFEEYILNGIQWANSSMDPTTRHPSEAVLINNLRLEIERWREGDYEGVTDTTRELFDHWFSLDRDKPLWFCQREAIETLIYLYELKKIKTVSSLIDAFSCLDVKGYEKYDRYPRYAFRMATGSGKTIVIALVIVWSFYNHIWEDKNDFTRFFLIIAPNLIVYDRLARDFENLSIFDDFELIPESWKKEFRIKVITRDTFSPSDRFLPPEDEGVIFVSNIHQIGLKEKKKEKEEERDLLSFFGKLSPGKEPYKSKSLKLWEILDNYPSLMVLKDEAHHIHRLESSWQNYLWGMDERLKESYGEGIFAELDFSATPKDEKGALFPWIIVDFSLKEALQTEIVKYPARVIVEDAPEIKRDAGMEAYRPYIKTALERWREQKKKLDELGKKPVLFVMGTDVEEANEIYKELLKEEDIDQGNMILIHSDLEKWEKTEKRLKTKISWKGGERELDKDLARDIVNDIDNPDNPFSIIVSAMMLNEGWDVNSVTLVLGLRSFASEREVLPEQVIGRGLRKLFRDQGICLDKWINVLEVVGPSKLLKTIQKLEEMEGIKIPDAPQKFFITFSPRDIGPEKMINIPILEGWYYWENINWKILEREILECLPTGKFSYEEIERLSIDYPYEVKSITGRPLAEGRIGSEIYGSLLLWINKIAKEIEEEIPLPNSFQFLRDLIKAYIEEKLFEQKVSVDDEKVEAFLLQEGKLSLIVNNIKHVLNEFVKNPLKTIQPEIKDFLKVSESKAFPWTKDFADSEKSLFVRTHYENGKMKKIPSAPIDNDLERNFVNFLNNAKDVISFVKNLCYSTDFYIRYFDPSKSRWRKFYPDFIVKGEEKYYIIETKGREDEEVKYKNEACGRWCETVNEAIDERWEYLYLTEDMVEKYRGIANSIDEIYKNVNCCGR